MTNQHLWGLNRTSFGRRLLVSRSSLLSRDAIVNSEQQRQLRDDSCATSNSTDAFNTSYLDNSSNTGLNRTSNNVGLDRTSNNTVLANNNNTVLANNNINTVLANNNNNTVLANNNINTVLPNTRILRTTNTNHPNTKVLSNIHNETLPSTSTTNDTPAIPPSRTLSEPTTTQPSRWYKLKKKFLQFRDFALSYRDGISLFTQEIMVSVRLARRVYWDRHRYSRREKLQLQQSAADLAKLLPITSMFMVFGLEFSTFAILRFQPGLMPTALRRKVEPEAQKLGIAPEGREEENARRKLKVVDQIGALTKALATHKINVNVPSDRGQLARVVEFVENLENGVTQASIDEIIAIAPAFRQHMTMEKLPRVQLLHLATLHIPNVAYKFAPRSFLARRLRHHVQKLRADDKEIHWEGIGNLNDEEVYSACSKRALVNGEGAMGGPEIENAPLLRHRLEAWMRLSLNREIPSSLLLVSCALMLRDAVPPPTDDIHTSAQVKLKMLLLQEEKCKAELSSVMRKLGELQQDIKMYSRVLKREEQAHHNDTVDGIGSCQSKSDREVLLGLGRQEVDLVRDAFARAQKQEGIPRDGPVPFGNALVNALISAVDASTPGSDFNSLSVEQVNKVLPMIDHDHDECLDYVDFVNAYEELCRRQEEMGELERKRVALLRLNELLNSDVAISKLYSVKEDGK